MKRPTIVHQKAIKQMYVRGTVEFGLEYTCGGEGKLVCYSDSSLAGDIDDRRSTSGVVFYLNKSMISWVYQKQKSVALSSCEAEFMAATPTACQVIWLRTLLSEVMGGAPEPVKLYVDNKSMITLMKNPVFHGRSKYINTRFHFIHECVERGEIIVEDVSGDEQRADILTKSLARIRFTKMRELIGVRNLESEA